MKKRLSIREAKDNCICKIIDPRKIRLSIILLLCMICLFAVGCAPNEASPGTEQEILEINDSQEENSPVDVDLTALSSTMVYAEIYNIMTEPDNYVGKIIRGQGAYNSFYYEETGQYFHYFIVSDATGCCPQGLDFVWNGEHTYPDDYPEIGDNIEVTGLFNKGEFSGQPYYYITVDDILILED